MWEPKFQSPATMCMARCACSECGRLETGGFLGLAGCQSTSRIGEKPCLSGIGEQWWSRIPHAFLWSPPIWVYVHIHYIHTQCTLTCTHMHIHAHSCTYIYLCTLISTLTHARSHAHMHTHMYTHMHTHIHTYAYSHTHINKMKYWLTFLHGLFSPMFSNTKHSPVLFATNTIFSEVPKASLPRRHGALAQRQSLISPSGSPQLGVSLYAGVLNRTGDLSEED